MGKHVQKKPLNIKLIIGSLIAITVISILLVIIGRSINTVPDEDIIQEQTEETNQTESTTNSEIENTALTQADEDSSMNKQPEAQDYPEQNTLSDGNFGYETPYFTVEYPSKWLDYLDIIDSEESGIYALNFVYTRDEMQAPLAVLYVGSQNDGIKLGTFTLGSEVYSVSIDFYTMDEELWTSEDVTMFAAMQEDMNELIQHLQSLDNFQIG